MKNSAFDIPEISGGAIARTKEQILKGDERGLKNFNEWVNRGALTTGQRNVLVQAFKTYYATV